VNPRAWLACSLLLAAPLAAQAAEGRWSVQLRGDGIADRADLRLHGDSSRILLESRDHEWTPLLEVRSDPDTVAFVADGARWIGAVAGDLIRGEAVLRDGSRAAWEGRRIQPGTDRWPVRPRITVRQLVIGSSDTLARFPDALLGRLLTRDALLSEHARLANRAGFPAADIDGIVARAERTMLGYDPVARRRVVDILEQIAASPAADARFRGLFRGPAGQWMIDLHDVAWHSAATRLGREALDTGAVVSALASVGLTLDDNPEPVAIRRATWLAWGRLRAMTPEIPDAMPGGVTLRALFTGYDEAVEWWISAVTWLMRSPWIETPNGWRSPSQLVGEFWEVDATDLPVIEPHHFGTYQAVPVMGGALLAPHLLVADNASAREWLHDPVNRQEALKVWRRLDPGNTLRVAHGDSTLLVASAGWVERGRLGGFLAAEDGIRIEPAILPVLAVGTIVHEWQHLLFEQTRWADSTSGAVQETAWGITLAESNPWLGEGAAEWATEAILAQEGIPPMLVFLESEKRLAIGTAIPEDTHVLGYLLVRTGINRTDDAHALRRILLSHLHDPAGFARAIGLDDDAHQRGVPRPQTLVVIPEVRFTHDGGVAESVTRMLRLPPSTEH
jgi:hypothetical protein